MDFTLNEEQEMLADSVRRFVEKEYSFEARQELAGSPLGYSEANWDTLGKMGLLGLNVPEQFGGSGAGPAETLIVMEALGRGLVLEPYLSTCVVAASMLARGGNAQQQQSLLPAIAEGRTRIALAALEPQARFDLWDVSTTARATGGHSAEYLLNGRKCVVIQGGSADTLIVAARTAGRQTDPAGISLFLVGAATPGVTLRSFPDIDGHRSADVVLDNVQLPASALLGTADHGYPLLEYGVDRGLAALCSEAVGAMSKLFEITVEYLRTRQQFGQPIGRFQALQHRCAEIQLVVEHSRSITLLAAAKAEDPEQQTRRKAVSAAKLVVSRHARFVGEQAVQLHGGIGMTDELDVGHYFKRLNCIGMTWGDSAHHTELYGNVL